MDKKNIFIGLTLITLAFAALFFEQKRISDAREEFLRQQAEEAGQQQETPPATATNAPEPAPAAAGDKVADGTAGAAVGETPAPPVAPTEPPVVEPSAPETVSVLENGYIRVEMTNRGGGIKRVFFKQTDPSREEDTYVFNEGGIRPALAVTWAGMELDPSVLPSYRIVTRTRSSITYERTAGDGTRIVRRYEISQNPEERDPYLIGHETSLENTRETPIAIPSLALHLGTTTPNSSDIYGQFQNASYFDGKDAEFIGSKTFTGSGGFLGIGSRVAQDRVRREAPSVLWGAVKNQFFAACLTPEQPASALIATGVDLPQDETTDRRGVGISADLVFDGQTLAAGQVERRTMDFFIGPKEYRRLSRFGERQDLLMQFGFLGWVSEMLLTVMYGIHSVVPNWGLAIIALTILVKLVFWPLTSKGIRTQKVFAKRMQPLQAEMKALGEKFKDNPQKRNQEMMKLYSKHGINPMAPVAGCLPLLIQMPIFLGLFWMLRTAAELRLAPFLWINDLSQPDQLFLLPFTIPLLGNAFNLLPILMGVTSYLQMRMTPQPATMDEQQMMMQKMFRIMPIIFVFILYNFAAGLALYWTSNNILTIIQQAVINKRLQPELDAIEHLQKTQGEKPPKAKKAPKPAEKAPAPAKTPQKPGKSNRNRKRKR